jgi:HEPN domain-containing protein
MQMNRADLQQLADLRIKEARILLDGASYSGAYYPAGYAIECALKACIAKPTKEHDFPDKDFVNRSWTHDLEKLLILAELNDQLETDRKLSKLGARQTRAWCHARGSQGSLRCRFRPSKRGAPVAEEILVKEQLAPEMIAGGHELTKRLRHHKDFGLLCSLWLYTSEWNRWKLMVGTPLVENSGPIRTYQLIQGIRNSHPVPDRRRR